MIAVCACAPDDPAQGPATPASTQNESETPLAPIERAQKMLQQYGYLPSTETAEREPGIRFLVDEAFEPGVLDAPTRTALRMYQESRDLEPTGEADTTTLAALEAPRCGHVDAPVEAPHAHDKFALGAQQTRGIAKVRIANYPPANADPAVRADVEAALLEFRQRTGFNYTRTVEGPVPSGEFRVEIWFYPTGGSVPAGCPSFNENPHALAVTLSTVRSTDGIAVGKVCIGVNISWPMSYGSGAPGGLFDFQTVLLHELGHAAGMIHSSVPGAVMWPSIGADQVLTSFSQDDLQGLWARWGKWVASPNVANRDLAWDATDGLYTIATDSVPGGSSIWVRRGKQRLATGQVNGTWSRLDGGAVRVTHDGARPWVVNSAGHLYRRNDTSGWEFIPGVCASDASGIDGLLFTADCDGRVGFRSGGDYQIWFAHTARVTRVAFDPRLFWLYYVDANNKLFRTNALSGITEDLNRVFVRASGTGEETNVGSFKDVDVGRDGTVWAIGTNNVPYIYQQQQSAGFPERNSFVAYPGSATSIAGSPDGFPSILSGGGVRDMKLFYSN